MQENQRNLAPNELKQMIEALIFANESPITIQQINKTIIQLYPDLEGVDLKIDEIVKQLNDEYTHSSRVFLIHKNGSSYQFKTLEKAHHWLAHIQHENLTRKLSQSAVETLAIIAYKQPITKPVVDSIRGVDSTHMVRQLLEKQLIKVSGRSDSPGRPLLYQTTDIFLTHFGLSEISELPKPREIEDILTDDDMLEHRQMLLELNTELQSKTNDS